jgi:hypothetical protein
MTDPVLFLDIDGVVNSAEWAAAGHMRCLGAEHDADHFAPHLCARLERVLAATRCAIVLSSSWRVTHTEGYIEELLRNAGAPSARLIGATPTWRTIGDGQIVGAYERRGAEIQTWLDANPDPARTFAIVDDSDDMGPLVDRLVRTSWQRGIEDHHVEALIAMLGGPRG